MRFLVAREFLILSSLLWIDLYGQFLSHEDHFSLDHFFLSDAFNFSPSKAEWTGTARRVFSNWTALLELFCSLSEQVA